MNARQAQFDKWAQRDVIHLKQLSQRIVSGIPPDKACEEVIGGLYKLSKVVQDTLSAPVRSAL